MSPALRRAAAAAAVATLGPLLAATAAAAARYSPVSAPGAGAQERKATHRAFRELPAEPPVKEGEEKFFDAVGEPLADAIDGVGLASDVGDMWVDARLEQAILAVQDAKPGACSEALGLLSQAVSSDRLASDEASSTKGMHPVDWGKRQEDSIRRVIDECQPFDSVADIFIWLLFEPSLDNIAGMQVIVALLEYPRWLGDIVDSVQEALLMGEWNGQRASRLLAIAACSTNAVAVNPDALFILTHELIRGSRLALSRLASVAERCRSSKSGRPAGWFRLQFEAAAAIAKDEEFRAAVAFQLARLHAYGTRKYDAGGDGLDLLLAGLENLRRKFMARSFGTKHVRFELSA